MRPSTKLLLIVTLIVGVSSASADVRYKIHPTNGEFVKTPAPCGAATRDEMFNRQIAHTPTLVVNDQQLMILVIKDNQLPADEMLEGVGWWRYDGKQTSKTQIITLHHTKKANQRVITIAVIRRMDEVECSERWVGLVEVSRGN